VTSAQVQQVIDALNHAAGAGWSVILRQQTIVGWQELVITSIFVILGIVCVPLCAMGIRRSLAGYKESSGYGSTYGWWALLYVPSALLILNGLIIGIFLGSDAIGHLLNPAAYAIYSVIP
jgi:hypothetical protein